MNKIHYYRYTISPKNHIKELGDSIYLFFLTIMSFKFKPLTYISTNIQESCLFLHLLIWLIMKLSSRRSRWCMGGATTGKVFYSFSWDGHRAPPPPGMYVHGELPDDGTSPRRETTNGSCSDGRIAFDWFNSKSMVRTRKTLNLEVVMFQGNFVFLFFFHSHKLSRKIKYVMKSMGSLPVVTEIYMYIKFGTHFHARLPYFY